MHLPLQSGADHRNLQNVDQARNRLVVEPWRKWPRILYRTEGQLHFYGRLSVCLAGNPDWFVANGAVTPPNLFTAQMLHFSDGQTLLGGYRAPRATTALGEVRLEFSSSTQAQMRWPGGDLALVRFQFGNTAPETPESGWWWNPAESGRGFSIEIQGNVIFVAGYMYEDSGKPIWYTASGTLTSPTRFSGRWERFRDGQGIGQPYRQPTTITPDAGSVLFNFLTPTTGQLTLPNGRVIAVQRFGF